MTKQYSAKNLFKEEYCQNCVQYFDCPGGGCIAAVPLSAMEN